MYTDSDGDDESQPEQQRPQSPLPPPQKKEGGKHLSEALSTALGKLTFVKKPATAVAAVSATKTSGGFGGGRRGKVAEKPSEKPAPEISRRPLTVEELQVIGMARDPTR